MRLARPLRLVFASILLAGASPAVRAESAATPHNVVIFVADGLRYSVVSPETAPAMAAVRREGVDFRNSHSLFPTVTTANASAIATGHRLGDTGDFGNTLYFGAPALTAGAGALIVFNEDDGVLEDAADRFDGNYLNETSLLAAARTQGFSTAAIGKVGPTALQDLTSRDGLGSVIVDDNTGRPRGWPLAPDVAAAITAAGLPTTAPTRGHNADAGDDMSPGTLVANKEQQDWFLDVATEVLLPRFKAAGKPFVMVVWSRDPDGTQHNEGDSLNKLVPGINGPTAMAGIRNASNDLQRVRDTLAALGLDKTTDVLVTADHGFSTASKQSASSPSAKFDYPDVPKGYLPGGFLAIDLAKALDLPLYDPTGKPLDPTKGEHAKQGAALLGSDPARPQVVIGANGGDDLIWLPNGDAKALTRRIVAALAAQDYTGAIFVDDALGPEPGALPLSVISLDGAAVTPRPAIVVGFKNFSTGCAQPELCAALVSDTAGQQGQGQHGSFGRADTRNFMAAVGPDFKAGYIDKTPVSNADWVPTVAKLLGVRITPKGKRVGRVMSEALRGGGPVSSARYRRASAAAKDGFVTVLRGQRVGTFTYFDTAGAPDRTLQGEIVR